MWLAAGNNLITAAGPNQKLTVDISAANPLFTVVPGVGGQDKLDSPPFTQFHGNVFSLFFCLLSLLFFKVALLASPRQRLFILNNLL